MGEYDRIQKKQKSRVVANVGLGHKQLAHLLDKRNTYLKANETIKNIAQLKKITDDSMVTDAKDIAGDNNRSTLAIAKIAEDNYVLYAQRVSENIRNSKDNYENLSKVRWMGSDWAGLHAEMFAVSNELDISKIAASQPICKRCLAALGYYDIEALNPGTQYTKQWIAPYDTTIDEQNPFPAQAIYDTSLNGISGSRFGMKDDRYYPIAYAVWSKVHATW